MRSITGSRADRMRKPVLDVLRSFTPILLVGLAYLFYEEAPLIGKGAKQVEEHSGAFERTLEKRAKALGIGPTSNDPAGGRADDRFGETGDRGRSPGD